MSSFTNIKSIDLRPAHDSNQSFVLRTDFQYHVGSYPSDHFISVPAGFHTDGISIPWCFAWIVQRWGKGLAAGILHDYLYRSKSHTRHEADRIFREALKVCGVSSWRRTVCYVALRTFGGFAWNKV